MRRFLLVLLVAFVLAPTTATAELSTFNGDMRFQEIQGPEGPEDYSWEVKLGEEEELKAIDDSHAGVFWEDGTQAMTITATAAHDSIGTSVPTTLRVTQPNIIILTVHHRDGNPAAGGAAFDYPVIAGSGWEGGIQIHYVEGPPENQPLSEPTCIVPDLTDRTLRASRKILHRAHCKLGRVRGERRREVRVTQQFRPVGRVLPVWTAVDVKAVAPGQYSRSS